MEKEWNIFAISLSFQSLSHFLHFLSISAPLLLKLLHSAPREFSSLSRPAKLPGGSRLKPCPFVCRELFFGNLSQHIKSQNVIPHCMTEIATTV
jgi:hypothetical protein